MVLIREPGGSVWSVRRKWWPFPDLSDIDDDFFGFIGFLLAVPFLLVWPFWLVGKLLGVRWVIEIERDGNRVGREKVRGWFKSRRRALEIAGELANTHARYSF